MRACCRGVRVQAVVPRASRAPPPLPWRCLASSHSQLNILIPLRYRHNQVVLGVSLARTQSRGVTSASAVAVIHACPGCGARAQTVLPDEAGYYSLERKAVTKYVESREKQARKHASNDAIALEQQSQTRTVQDEKAAQSLKSSELTELDAQNDIPYCDRCHQLVHHHTGTSIVHPSMQSVQETIEASPHKYNHVYHVLDAADFPMSLLPALTHSLDVWQRTRNRRARHRFGQKTELSFVITRSDLLAPKKEQVDRLMPYLVSVLRDALGRHGENVRLSNVVCVSAKRGWWTTQLKQRIFQRGHGGWMVGKVNVGKSNLFEVVFPKGRMDSNLSIQQVRAKLQAGDQPVEHLKELHTNDSDSGTTFPDDTDSDLLPPPRKETAFPRMPVVSALPGTTASPIRIPFGNGRGELVDLPGLARSDLEQHVAAEHRESLVMRTRVVPKQYTIRPGQSLVLGGGLVRITPKLEQYRHDAVMLAYPFVPIEPHLTSTAKAEAALNTSDAQSEPTQSASAPVQAHRLPGCILDANTPRTLGSAGVFALSHDVTRQRAGPLTRRSAVALKPEALPFKVLSVDLLIESLGWVELTTQVRRSMENNEKEEHFPAVEVFTPHGMFIGERRPMGAWLLNREQEAAGTKRRPWRNINSQQRKAAAV